MSRRVVITGIGVVAPNGIGHGRVWDGVLSGKSAVRKIRKFDGASFGPSLAGEVDGFDATDFMPTRLARKLDPYTQYAVAAARLAFDDGKVDLDQVNKQDVGVYVGNCFGGWEVTDRELRNLHQKGVRSVSPFQATAWFPAAPQGQISILFGLKGHSKTIVCDRASGVASIGYAARSIALGYADVICAGGTEAVATPFAYLACTMDGILARGGDDPTTAYRPFDEGRDGLVPGEGAVFVVLEDREHARRRGAHVYGEIRGFGMTTDPCHPLPLPAEERGLSRAMTRAIDDAEIGPDDVTFVMADAVGTREGDRQEATAIRRVFGARDERIPVTAPKSMTGHMFGAAGAMDVALAALSIDRGAVPPTVNVDKVDADCSVALVRSAVERDVAHVLVNGRGSGGVNASLVVSRDL